MSREPFSLKGKRALITGSSRGIGRELALAFARAGADLIVHGTGGGEALDLVAQECRGHDVKAECFRVDLSGDGAGRDWAGILVERGLAPDILVLNASVQIRKAWREITADDFQMQMRVNLQSSMELMQVLAPSMQQKKWGRILTIGSVQQRRPHPDMLVYSASKAALMNMVLSLARQLAPDGITVNNLAPGIILTDRNTEVLSDPAYAEQARRAVPAGFFGESSDCTGAALLLCSDEGRYITGQDLYVDGGLGLA